MSTRPASEGLSGIISTACSASGTNKIRKNKKVVFLINHKYQFEAGRYLRKFQSPILNHRNPKINFSLMLTYVIENKIFVEPLDDVPRSL